MRRFVAFCSVAIIGGAMLAGCGGSSSKTGSGVSSTTNAAGGGGSSGNDALSKLVSDASKQKYKVTYESGDNNNSLTYAQDGNGNSVFGEGDAETFVSNGATISCDKSSGSWTCTQSPVSVGALANPFLGALALQKTYFSALGGHLGNTSDKTIAGRDAECVTISPKDLVGKVGGALADVIGKNSSFSGTSCFDKQTGVTLEVSDTNASGKKSTVVAVTNFEMPTASDFTPPATPKKAPQITLPSGITLPPGITLPTIPGGG
jgi:hypothetical protein